MNTFPQQRFFFYHLPDVLQRFSKGCGHQSNFALTTQLKTEIYKTDVTHIKSNITKFNMTKTETFTHNTHIIALTSEQAFT